MSKKYALNGSILLCEVFGPKNFSKDSKVIKGNATIEIKKGPCRISRLEIHLFIFNKQLPFVTIVTKLALASW